MGPAWTGHSSRPDPASPGAGRSQECCHLSSLVYPEAGVYIISKCLPSPLGVHRRQYTAEGSLSLHAIPPKQVGRRGSWLDQTSFPDDWEVAPIKKKKKRERERERDTVASYYNFIMHFQHYCLFAIHSSFCLKCLFRSFFHFFLLGYLSFSY